MAIAGGHGQIALRLTRLLAERGDDVRSLIRNPDHADDVRAAGGDPVVCDLEAADEQTIAERRSTARTRSCSRPAPDRGAARSARARWTSAAP